MSDPTFWQIVDTTPRFYRHCTCKTRSGQHDWDCTFLTDWEKERNGCMGQSGSGEQCRELAGGDFPFCSRFHADSAIEAFAMHLAHASRHHARYGSTDPYLRAVLRFIDRTLYPPLSDKYKKALGRFLDIEFQRPAEVPTLRAARRCALYRHYDADGVLLYVGISVDPESRQKQHEANSPWWRFVAESDVDWYLIEPDAAAAERRAIVDEAPIFNKAGATPERDPRAVQYLVDHGALDLLRAAA